VTHPHREPVGADVETREEIARVGDGDARVAVLAMGRARDATARQHREDAHPVADAEDGHAEVDDRGVGERRALGVDARGAAGEHDPLGRHCPHAFQWDVVRVNLAIDLLLANTTRDQLRVLAAEIENENHAAPLTSAPCRPARAGAPGSRRGGGHHGSFYSSR